LVNLGAAHLWLFGAPLERGPRQSGLLGVPRDFVAESAVTDGGLPAAAAEAAAVAEEEGKAEHAAEVVEGRSEARLYWEEAVALTGGSGGAEGVGGSKGPPAAPLAVACAPAPAHAEAVRTLEAVEKAAAAASASAIPVFTAAGGASQGSELADAQLASLLRASALSSLGGLHLLHNATRPAGATAEAEAAAAADSRAKAKGALSAALEALEPLALDHQHAWPDDDDDDDDDNFGGGTGGNTGGDGGREAAAGMGTAKWLVGGGKVVRGRTLAALGVVEHLEGKAVTAEGLLRAALDDVASSASVTSATASQAAMAAWGDSWGAGGVGGAPVTGVCASDGAADGYWALAAYGDVLAQWDQREREGAAKHGAAKRLARALALRPPPAGGFQAGAQRWGVPVVACGAFHVPTLAEIAAELED
jgi:SWI/SNF-related matrix-associated actin-dependent regulator 1 of chromatin subfamily A